IRRTPSGRLTAVNELGLEEYLYGVLKMEVNPAWPSEALKAQAVAARTLALYSLGRFRAEGYDVRATTDSQVYGGISAEDPRTTAAVDVTRGEIVSFAGRPIFAAYHSDSGGFTENSEHVWGGRYAYLKAVPDPFTSATPWVARVDAAAFEDRLRRAGHVVSGITAMDVTGLTPSGRAGAVKITSTSGVLTLRATELRAMLGADALKSTMFTVRLLPGEPAVVEFAGRGSGHGVGLSQWGARGQALVGKSYTDILRYYYSGITVDSR
ncbi:MAG: SpoIID/LytB domain-containing protein, partial [bacterium]